MAWGGLGGSGSNGMHAALRRQAAIACVVWAVVFSALAAAYALPSGPDAVVAVSDATPYVGQAVRFDASGSVAHDKGNGAVVAYRFAFGDGSGTGWQSSAIAEHAYAAPAHVTANVTVQDGRGLEGTASVRLEVRPVVPSVPTPDLRPIQLAFWPSAPRTGDVVTATLTVLNEGNETAVSAAVRFLDVRPDGNTTWIGNVSLTGGIAPAASASVVAPSFSAEDVGNHTIRAIVADVQPTQATGSHELRAILVVSAQGGTTTNSGPPLSIPPVALGLAAAGAVSLAAAWLLLRRRPPGPLEPPPETPQDRSPPPLWPP